MSLINEALKKAQRQRTEEAQSAPPMPGGGSGGRRGKSGHNTLILGAGAFVLVIISVVITVMLVNRPAEKPPVVASATPAPKVTPPAATSTAPAPIVIAPVIKPAEPEMADKPAAAIAAETKKASLPPATAPAQRQTSEPGTRAPSAPPDPMATLAKGDERVHAFVDAVRVTAIRPVGNESRVLMNERVYRVNDIVERNLGIKLIKVETDHLTFSDPAGVTYVKYF